RNNGESWEDITPPSGMSPKLNMINCIDPSPFKKGTAYVAATSYKFGDYTPYLYRTEDYGKTWSLITKGIRNNHYTRAIRSDKVREGLLYAGTEWGMYISFDDGASWKPFQLNLPITSIRDLHVRDNDLIAATHGRSFWMIDDLTPLHQLSADMSKQDAVLFKPDKAYRMQQSGWGQPNPKLEGSNHPNGAIINYYIREFKETDTVRIEIREANGTLIQDFSNHAKEDKNNPATTKPLKVKTGGNRFIWNMQYPGFSAFKGMVLYSSPNRGPKAVPGTYKVVLHYNSEIAEADLTIVKDPRLPNSQQDFQEQFDFLMAVRDQVSRANQAIVEIRRVKRDLDYLKGKATDQQELKAMLHDFETKLTEVENNIHMTKNQSRQDPLNYGIRINNRLAFLMADSQRGDYPPTNQAREFFVEIKKELDVEISSLEKLMNTYVGQINSKISDSQIKMISVN
ncbi:MAG: glycosyl hydrolase, partial [Eudoraea sp.]|nr:glycosyl hydrolase [Eudoraea sp.]